jgi:uncharacterized BrkB/YihY/UPF0761 family membrane protein
VGIEGIIEAIERVAASYFEHRMATYGAALAYRGLFGLFPFILLLVASGLPWGYSSTSTSLPRSSWRAPS